MPDYRSPTGRFVRWSKIVADLRRRPGMWLTVFPDAPASLAKTVRYRRHPDLTLEDGVVEATVRNEYQSPDGLSRGDVLLRFRPHPQEHHDQHHATDQNHPVTQA